MHRGENPRIMQDFRRKQGIERDTVKKNIFLPVEKNEKKHWTKCAEKNGVGVIRDNRVLRVISATDNPANTN